MGKEMNVVALLEAGLRAEHLRQKTIASNVANLQTPGYRRLDVQFEELLAEAVEAGSVDPDELKMEIYETRNTGVKDNGNDVHLEGEIGEMVKNTLRYKTFIRLLSKKYQQMERAIDTR
jgi:flagellar basal-body rod protein FlgB